MGGRLFAATYRAGARDRVRPRSRSRLSLPQRRAAAAPTSRRFGHQLVARRKSTMPTTITRVIARDIRFPTSRTLDGSDAMNRDPDYSAAYVVLQTDRPDGLAGHGLTFTIGRGNELCVAAIQALGPLVVGKTLESFTADMGAFWHMITGDSQL